MYNTLSREVALDPFSDLFNRSFSPLHHLPDRNDGKEFGEECIEEHEKGDTTCQYRPFHPGGDVECLFHNNPLPC